MTGASSDEGVRRGLARLVDQGVVLADQHPHATLYLLNRNHVAANAIVSWPASGPRSLTGSLQP
jgi:hypothetical protein